MSLTGAAEYIGGRLLIEGFEWARRKKYLRYKLIRPKAEVRLASAAILRLQHAGQYLLVENLHRPGSFGPFGGVIKYITHAAGPLDELSFRPEDVGPYQDMRNDLRGYVPRGHLQDYLKWFGRLSRVS